METELKIKGILGSKRSLPMPICCARCKKRKRVESDNKGSKNINTIQQGVPGTIELQFVDHICGCREKFPDFCVQEEENGWSVTPDHDDDDPQYKIFLASTVQRGTAYTTTLEENGSPLFLHYETENVCRDEPDYVCRRRVKNIEKGHDDDDEYLKFLANTVQKGTSYVTKLEENGLPLFIHYEKEDGSGEELNVSRRRAKSIKKGYNDNGGGNDVDPQYMTFLANTVQRGTAYTTTLEESGSPLVLHYEKEDGCGDDPVDVCRRRVKNIEKRHNAKEKAFGSVSGNYNLERANGFEMVLEKNKDVYVVVDNEMFEVPKSHYEYDIDNGSHKERSTQNRRNNGSINGRSTQNWRISEDREEEYIDEDCVVLNQNNCVVKTSSSANWHMECGRNHSEDVEAMFCKERIPDLSPGNQHVEYDLKDFEEENIDNVYLVLLQNMTCENSVSKASCQSNQPVEYDLKHWEEDEIDYDYLALLQNMTCEKYAIKACQSNQIVEYGCNQSEDVEVIQNNCMDRSLNHFISSTEYLNLDETSELLGESMQSPFRKKIINILKRPYNQSEYVELLKDVKVRKPILKNLELRDGRDMLYPTSKIGKSYLDHHKDLKKRLDEVRTDKHKRLNILRGFFFWLQNVTLVGVFKPWNDPTCLAIVPGSC
nr:transcriptional regulator ATRX homolog [Ipomoea batatas]